MKKILVTGANGQLGRCIRKHSVKFHDLTFYFCTSNDLDIGDKVAISQFLEEHKIDYFVNCAAYTNVEEAEEQKEKAFLINAEAVLTIATECHKRNITLFHFSTDYVFNGEAQKAYSEEDKPYPVNIYGASKLRGEEYIQNNLEQFYIFRTSWLYSEFGHNFYNTILRKASEGAELNITTSQKGTPTNANDLAEIVLDLIESNNQKYGLYHLSNEGEATWYDFARQILEYSGKLDSITLNATGFYKTKAVRPKYSVLSKEKIKSELGVCIKGWKESLHELIDEN